MIKKLYLTFAGLFLLYMLWPGPGSISVFKQLPDSYKSTLAGDNVAQVPNVAGYFSNKYRNFVTYFYRTNYFQKTLLPFPPMRLNHPPEVSWNVIKKHTDSTFLEEFVYPLRDSLYVNGLEPFYEDGSPKFWGSSKFSEGGKDWYTKTTIRFYPSSVFVRLIVWFSICLSILYTYRLGRKILS